MSKHVKESFDLNGKEVVIETGKIAALSHGAITLTMGGTTLFAAVTVDSRDTDLDYFPLTVEYIEKMYASGKISGSRFRKREGLPSDEATIKAREVDHSIRSLFPKSFKKLVNVILTVLSYDGINDPQALTVLGSSLAIMQAGVPFAGPCSSAIVGIDSDMNIVLNPSKEERESYLGEFIVTGVDDRPLSFEGWGIEVPETKMEEVLDKANELIKNLNAQQKTFIEKVDIALDLDPNDFNNKPAPVELIDRVKAKFESEIHEIMFSTDSAVTNNRGNKLNELAASLYDEMKAAEEEVKFDDVKAAVDYAARYALRKEIIASDKRISGRGLDEIRELKSEIDILPIVHGSALFSRGITQSLSIVTLASASNKLMSDDMEGEDTKRFMHHYNFPPYSTGEAGRFRYHPGRREVGHGTIGENALMNMIPSEEDFPYTIRTVSEIMSSNGSTSMAATCASSMALMAAGVPMKEQVAGIGIGLVTEDDNESNYKLITDIEGIEDFYGDMDFKVCGTKNGITAIQFENKLQGVPISILKEAFKKAKTARLQLLEVMNSTISESRAEVSETAPKVESIQIQQDQIGELIGPGGKNIKELVERSKEYGKDAADINITDDGIVQVASVSRVQMDFIKDSIKEMFKKAVVGDIYDGVVDKVMNYGAFVDVSKNISGLVHVSEITDKFVKDASELLKEGQQVRVKVIKVENGKTSMTMKGVDQPEKN
ncbi:MAG: polyribonucleotide nucleotidyltransferase [Candidatus Dojkabacteria bacterium]|nr:polyribonucleotide nucleotidyltransferase [Candidatus Dojkabacteria bacterium]MDQ7021913.1 polyribonucleotide nucleotidyltransferase [Candidatus Dojkabacteria bacterium]